jgi:hypothetical protein
VGGGHAALRQAPVRPGQPLRCQQLRLRRAAALRAADGDARRAQRGGARPLPGTLRRLQRRHTLHALLLQQQLLLLRVQQGGAVQAVLRRQLLLLLLLLPQSEGLRLGRLLLRDGRLGRLQLLQRHGRVHARRLQLHQLLLQHGVVGQGRHQPVLHARLSLHDVGQADAAASGAPLALRCGQAGCCWVRRRNHDAGDAAAHLRSSNGRTRRGRTRSGGGGGAGWHARSSPPPR